MAKKKEDSKTEDAKQPNLSVKVVINKDEFVYDFNLGDVNEFLLKSQQNYKEIGEMITEGLSKSLGVTLGDLS